MPFQPKSSWLYSESPYRFAAVGSVLSPSEKTIAFLQGAHPQQAEDSPFYSRTEQYS